MKEKFLEKESFRYTVPASGVKTNKKIVVNAWRTDCPGLIIQEDGLGLSLTHEASGFIARSYEERGQYEKICRELLAWGKIDWTVATGNKIMEQAAALSELDAAAFIKILHRNTRMEPKEFIAAAAERANNREKFTAEQRAKV